MTPEINSRLDSQLLPLLRNPKRRAVPEASRSRWFSYYAGYSDLFVRDALTQLNLDPGASVLDAWNGSGTTTQFAEELGYQAYGFDINPAMIVVAKARLLDYRVHGSVERLAKNIADRARHWSTERNVDADPLTAWLQPETAKVFRAFDHAIQKELFDAENYVRLAGSTLTQLSSLAAFYYVALFRTLRGFLTPFFTSNPTWIKNAKTDAERVLLTSADVEAAFLSIVSGMDARLACEPRVHRDQGLVRKLEVASADSLPLQDATISAVVTSPPYCTRIDYVVATRPELALLGCTAKEDGDLRDRMTGTPTIVDEGAEITHEWGQTCSALLDAVSQHESHASNGYYLKYYRQYFQSISRSLRELDRILIPGGQAVFVVQDSFYKELRVDLPLIFTEMGDALGWRLTKRVDFAVGSNFAAIHPQAREYRSSTKAVESALIFVNEGAF